MPLLTIPEAPDVNATVPLASGKVQVLAEAVEALVMTFPKFPALLAEVTDNVPTPEPGL